MKRIIILDISGMYAQIYDEIYCELKDIETYDYIKKQYSDNEKYLVIEISI